jgi:hypothetical protein
MTVTFSGNEAVLTIGTSGDHSIFDIYIDDSLWESFDGYSTAGDRAKMSEYSGANTTRCIHALRLRAVCSPLTFCLSV